MKSFWKLFFHAIPLALGIILSLISIAYTTEVTSGSNPDETVATIMAAILFGIIGFPMLVASAISFTKKFSETSL
jgi:hypothetical protein